MAYRRTAEVQARLDAQRVRLVDAATGLLAEQGFAACSMAAVAARAGVAAGTVYNHFTGKGELVAEVFRAVVGREMAAVQAAADDAAGNGEAGDHTAAARVVAVVETFAGRALKAPRLAYALLAEPVDPVVDELRLEFRTAFRDIIAVAVAAGVAAAELPAQDIELVSSALVGAIGEALAGPLAGTPDPAVVPALVSFARRSLGARDAAYA